MGIYQKVEKQMREWMPNYVETTYAIIKQSLKEQQDSVNLFFGPPGRGKSNLAFQDCLLKTRFVNELLGEKRKFTLKKQTAWMGKDFIKLFSEPAGRFSKLMESPNKDELQNLISKYKGQVWWLDEAKDLNVMEFMSQFNRSFSGILATCRALQFNYQLCLDSPTKLLPSIREYRITSAEYIFITNKKNKFDNGEVKNLRASAFYGGKEFNRIVFAEPKEVRRSLNKPMTFIRKFPPFCTESIPMFPKGKMWNNYQKMKHANMGKIIIEELNKLGILNEDQLVSLSVAAKILSIKPKTFWWAVGQGGIPIQIQGSYMKISLSWVREILKKLKSNSSDKVNIYRNTKEKIKELSSLGLNYVCLDKVIIVNEGIVE